LTLQRIGLRASGRARAALAAAVALLVAGCAQDRVVHRAERPALWAAAIPGMSGLPNLFCVTPGLYRSAQPSSDGLLYLSEARPLLPDAPPVKTVLSLRAFDDEDEELLGRSPLVRTEGISFKAWHPEDEDVVKFLRIATTPELQPLLVHCKHGSDRTGMMIAIYRIAVQGWEKEAAVDEMTNGGYGFHALWQNLPAYVMELDVGAIQAQVAEAGPWR